MAGVASSTADSGPRSPLPDDPAGPRVPRDLLRGAVLLAGAHVAVDVGRLRVSADAGVRLELRQLSRTAFSEYQDQILRTFGYAFVRDGAVRAALPFPLAYVIAFEAGRFRNLVLGLVILPFFVTFLIRTIAWKTILADDGWVVSALGTIGLLPDEGGLFSASWAVMAASPTTGSSS